MAWRVTSSYRMNQSDTGVGGIAVGAPMVAVLGVLGQKAASVARELAPVETGRYRSSFRVQLGTRGTGRKKRAQVTVENTAPYAAALEWGNARTRRPARVMGRTQARMRAGGQGS